MSIVDVETSPKQASLKKAHATFARLKNDLIRDQPGKWVCIHEDTLLGVSSDPATFRTFLTPANNPVLICQIPKP
jgi:hypothetical protein